MDKTLAEKIKELKERTSCTFLECRAALEEVGGDFEAAKQILRNKHRPRFGVMDDSAWFQRGG